MKHFTYLIKTVSYAYIEPGSTSYILQLIIGALIGGVFAIKLFWGKIKSFFRVLFFRTKKHEK